MSNLIAAPYDWSLLNNHGNHGGNILTTTLQKPGVLIPILPEEPEYGPAGFFPSDSQPWLSTIDFGSWRDDNATTTRILYRVNVASPGAPTAKAVWTANVVPGEYNVQASWLVPTRTNARVDDLAVDDATLDVPMQDDIGLNPVKNAKYRIFDGANLVATVTVDQTFPSGAIEDGGATFDPLG